MAAQPADRPQALHQRARRRHARDSRLALAGLMRILALNGGSSSFKCRLDELGDRKPPSAAPTPVWERHVELRPGSTIAETLEPVLASIPGPVDMAGHRVVHGGPRYRA